MDPGLNQVKLVLCDATVGARTSDGFEYCSLTWAKVLAEELLQLPVGSILSGVERAFVICRLYAQD